MKSHFYKHPPLPANVHHTQLYRQRMQKLRVILPVFASALIMLVIFWSEIARVLEEPALTHIPSEQSIYQRNRLSEPQFYSFDKKGRPYHLAAKSAVQKSKHNADLEHPQTKLQMEDGKILRINSEKGFYNDLTKKFDYQNNVQLSTDTGYQLATSLAHVKLEEKQAYGDRPVQGEGPTGKIWAQGFYTNQMGILHFKGKSRLIIEKDKQATVKGKP
jgi:lipopolysaccharide export system protein LptC